MTLLGLCCNLCTAILPHPSATPYHLPASLLSRSLVLPCLYLTMPHPSATPYHLPASDHPCLILSLPSLYLAMPHPVPYLLIMLKGNYEGKGEQYKQL
ncbi:hypothetical protein E2C01_079043 [Portunus trituberculatus]|uniref:Uncharacterized protein n=1 Tax=Portunus trituberculatus TaxID=210409 RepID=A0A5B7IRQ8_PORTR|nr:hypothetical protein [Portunus trituberculatus]